MPDTIPCMFLGEHDLIIFSISSSELLTLQFPFPARIGAVLCTACPNAIEPMDHGHSSMMTCTLTDLFMQDQSITDQMNHVAFLFCFLCSSFGFSTYYIKVPVPICPLTMHDATTQSIAKNIGTHTPERRMHYFFFKDGKRIADIRIIRYPYPLKRQYGYPYPNLMWQQSGYIRIRFSLVFSIRFHICIRQYLTISVFVFIQTLFKKLYELFLTTHFIIKR